MSLGGSAAPSKRASFNESTITEVLPPLYRQGAVWLSWTASVPSGTWFQVYLNGSLAWWGTATQVAIPTHTGIRRLDIGSVAPGDQTIDFSADLPAAPLNQALLSWLGGSYEDASGGDDVNAFNVYGESTPGGGIDYASPLATITAYPGGLLNDGWGMGGFGQGGFGRAASAYSWESAPLYSGLWHFGVTTENWAGDEGPPRTATAWVMVPPLPPARDASGNRLEYSYNSVTQTITLTWLASPG